MNQDLIQVLNSNSIAVLATDTIYGVVASAHSTDAVARLYEIKGRDEGKPFIILIPSIDSLADFGVVLSAEDRTMLTTIWPNAVTVILPVDISQQEKFTYLHRGTNELAFRLPAKESLRVLLEQTGSLVAPSANPQGLSPAKTIAEARAYFANTVDFYEDGGAVEGNASTIVSLKNGTLTILRQGAVTIDTF
ncbi:MAG: L-threonylcarbamoyladenylate synthase [Candidatus Paceibacterota bacterium]